MSVATVQAADVTYWRNAVVAAYTDRKMHRSSLARKDRASASASATEAEFARRARDTGLLVRPRYDLKLTALMV